MKKFFLILVTLFVFSVILFAAPEETSSEKINIWAVIGVGVVVLVLLGGGTLFLLLLVYGGRGDFGKIRISENSKLNLKFKEFLDTEEDEINLKFVIRKIIGNQITLHCKVCKGTHEVLTKTIGFNKTKGITQKIKKLLDYPIDISVSPSEKESLLIEAERVIPEPKTESFLISDTTEIDEF